MLPKPQNLPLFLYATRHGTLYNLTPTNKPKNIPGIQLCYGDFHDYMETIRNLPEGMSVKKFLGYGETTVSYFTAYDFSKEDCMTGCQDGKKVKIKCNKGYTEVNAKMYDDLVDLIKPDIYVGLTQYPSLHKDHQNESNKSHKRAINKTKSYLQFSPRTKSQQIDPNNPYRGPIRLAALHGGKNLSLISRSLEQILDHAIDGIVVCDLCEVESIRKGQEMVEEKDKEKVKGETLEEREEVYRTVLKRLEQEYAREGSYFKGKKLKLFLAGLGKLQDIQHALKFGFQGFQISYPFITAQNHQALLLNPQTNCYQPHTPIKKQQLKPLDPKCNCHTCLNHSEAYIAHLIDCHELTAKVLLSIHNIYVYESWLDRYRGSDSCGVYL